jgi:putative Mg2+ transporter-C (MgtC) family protein
MEPLFQDFADLALPPETIAARLLVAALLGGLIGLEREWRARPAGLRTHMLMALAACVFTLLTIEIVSSDFLTVPSVQADPVRVIEAVTAGVAFLAAGTLIQGRGRVHGLPTGAGMWLAGAVGLACGVGAYLVAVLAAMLGLGILTILGWVETRLGFQHRDSPPDDSAD